MRRALVTSLAAAYLTSAAISRLLGRAFDRAAWVSAETPEADQ